MQSRVMAAKKSLGSVRNFSQSIKPPTPKSGAGLLPWIVGAGALGGFTYLNYQMSSIKSDQMRYMESSETMMSELTQSRLS